MSKLPDPLLKIKDPELWDWIDANNYIINGGHYQFPLVTTIPSGRSNDGEQRIYATGDVRAFYVYINGVWCVINFDSTGAITGAGGSGFGDHIIDNDGNTLVHTQFVSNEDRIRTYTAGVYVMAVDTYGLQIAPAYKMVFDGLGGDTYWTYSSASSYMQCYLNGTLRMEM